MTAGASCGIIILAAGASTRMGTSKQMLIINNEPLLVRTVREALASQAAFTTVVLGAQASAHARLLQTVKVDTVVNANWEQGIGSSIKAGVMRVMRKRPDAETIIVVACDQPYLDKAHLDKLIAQHSASGKEIVASAYAGTHGVPALFASTLFDALLQIPNTEGAKKIIRSNPGKVAAVDFPLGEVDLDTPGDHHNFNQK